jgi:hypothetical protein
MQMTSVETRRDCQRCPRCAGPMFRDYDSGRLALLCLLCGEYTFPSLPRRLTAKARQAAARAVARRLAS